MATPSWRISLDPPMTASLAASLLDRSTKRLSVVLAVGKRAPAQSVTGNEDGTLFFVKGKASAEQFIRVRRAVAAPEARDVSPFFAKGEATAEPFIPTPANDQIETAPEAPTVARPVRTPRRERLWLRVAPERRLQVKRAAAHLGQSAQDFMRDALRRFLADPTRVATVEAPWYNAPSLRWHGVSFAPERVKLAIAVDAACTARVHALAAASGQTLQAWLTQAMLLRLSVTTPAIAKRAAAELSACLVHTAHSREALRFAATNPASERLRAVG